MGIGCADGAKNISPMEAHHKKMFTLSQMGNCKWSRKHRVLVQAFGQEAGSRHLSARGEASLSRPSLP